MPTPAKSNPDVADLEEQLKALRADVATLADLLKGAAQHKATEAGKVIHEHSRFSSSRRGHASKPALEAAS